MANVYNFFKFLEDKAGKKLPLKLKLLTDPESITKEDLTVKGTLSFYRTPITSLPNSLTVGGNLELSGTLIKTLPNNLTVGGFLVLSSTLIETLPKNLEVGGKLYIDNTPISNQYTKNEIQQMVPGVKGGIYS